MHLRVRLSCQAIVGPPPPPGCQTPLHTPCATSSQQIRLRSGRDMTKTPPVNTTNPTSLRVAHCPTHLCHESTLTTRLPCQHASGRSSVCRPRSEDSSQTGTTCSP